MVLSNPTGFQPTFQAPSAGIYAFQLVANDGQADSRPEQMQASQGLERALSRLLVLREQYTELKSNESFMKLQDSLEPMTATEWKANQPIYRQILDWVKLNVAGGAMAPGSQLPTVRQLAVDLDLRPVESFLLRLAWDRFETSSTTWMASSSSIGW